MMSHIENAKIAALTGGEYRPNPRYVMLATTSAGTTADDRRART